MRSAALPLAFFGMLLCTGCGPKVDPVQRALIQRIAEKQTLERDVARLQAQIEEARTAMTANNAEVEAERTRMDRIQHWKTGQGQEQRDLELDAQAKLIVQMEDGSKALEARIDSLSAQQDLLTTRLANYADVDSKPKNNGLK